MSAPLLDLGPLVLGGNVFGWSADRDTSFRVLDAFVDAGGRAIDTADVYSRWVDGHEGGESESIIGAWLAARPGMRDRVAVATKVGMLDTRDGLSADNVRAALDDSLRRLQTDYVDIYFAHRDDENAAQEETFGAFDAAVRAGKVRTVGASNFAPERLRSAAALIADAGFAPLSYAQDHYNLVERGAEKELLPTVVELGMQETPYFSLAAGFLTGKYRPGVNPETARGEKGAKYVADERNLALLDVLTEIARGSGVSVAAVSLAWLREREGIAAPIASARAVGQLEEIVQSFSVELTAEETDAIDRASAR